MKKLIAHGMIPPKIMEVNPDTVEAFLGIIEDPQPPPESFAPSSETFVDSAFRVIMFTDMKDSSALTTRLGDTQAVELFRTHNAVTRRALNAHNGREIQHTGMVSWYPSPLLRTRSPVPSRSNDPLPHIKFVGGKRNGEF